MANTAKQTYDALVSPPGPRRLLAPRLAGAALLAATAGSTWTCTSTGYRLIPVIGVAVPAPGHRRRSCWPRPSPSPAAAWHADRLLGAGYAASTLLGYLVSMWVGLFGFPRPGPRRAWWPGVIEVAALAVLGYLTLRGLPRPGPLAPLHRLHASLPGGAAAAISAVSVVAVIVLASRWPPRPHRRAAPSVTAAAGAAGGPVLKMTMKNFKFFPANPEVQPGERVEVTNFDSAPHSVSPGVRPRTTACSTPACWPRARPGSSSRRRRPACTPSSARPSLHGGHADRQVARPRIHASDPFCAVR